MEGIQINPRTGQGSPSDPCPKLDFGDSVGHKYDPKGKHKPRALVHRREGGGVHRGAGTSKKFHKANKMGRKESLQEGVLPVRQLVS